MIDLRSDTVTTPTDAMRRAIADAPVGDDVFGDDPTVRRLEETVAARLGKPDAVYVTSGTMANQIALRLHTRPGDVVLAAGGAHVDTHEVGAANALAGVTVRQLPGERGMFEAGQVTAAIPKPRPGMPNHLAQPVSLVTCENTHNAAGGSIWPLDQLNAVATAAHEGGAATHLDGARLWNASVASGIAEEEYAAAFDTVGVCFSKGLGAPMGSALVGSGELIAVARRFRHMYGGGVRQAGMMAAGALHGLEHHWERLAHDHANASRLAAGLAEMAGVQVEGESVETNIVYFTVAGISAGEFCSRLRDAGVAMLPFGPARVRAVTHMGIEQSDIDAALKSVEIALRT